MIYGQGIDSTDIEVPVMQSDTFFTGMSKSSSFTGPIDYSALDSMIFSADGKKVFLYNEARVTYEDTELKAYYIELDINKKEVYAEGMVNEIGEAIGDPVFTEGEETIDSKSLRYNFETKKGIITQVRTEQGEGYVLSERAKKLTDDIFNLSNGKYTVCDAENPHFYLHLTKARVISNKKIITGPAYMVLEDFPIYFPLLPFGYFPNATTYTSGILMPSYGEEVRRGFFLRDGGYYWATSQYFDFTVRGDIYSKGSWAAKFHTNYRKRYRFSGSFDFKYAVNVYGEKSVIDSYSRTPQFQVTWSHSQDSKANPYRTFSANVNFSTSGYDKENSLSEQNYLRTQKSSNISYSRRWEDSPFTFSANLRHSQNSTDTTISLTLPEMTFSMKTVYPFKKKNSVGEIKWYEKISISYTGNFRNTITSKESELFEKSLAKDWKNGIKHNIPISLPSINLFGHINISPGFSYSENWYFKTLEKTYDENNLYIYKNDSSHVRIDTITGLKRSYRYSYSISATTNIYGNFTPLNSNSKIKGIRHKLTPSLSFGYTPDFGNPKFGFWKQVQVNPEGTMEYYDIFEGGIYGGSPGRGASGNISLSLNNSVEMKILDTNDTTNAEQSTRKVSLLDNLSLNASYNLIADSLNMSTINFAGRTTVAGVSVNFGGTIDPYMTNADGTGLINEYVWNHKKGIAKIGRLTRAFLSFGMSFESKKGQSQAQENREIIEKENLLPGDYIDYADFNIPWDFKFDYSFNYLRPNPFDKPKITQSVRASGSANITDKWRINASTNFDIMAGKFSFTTINISRDLHCWQMAFSFVPFGYMKSYSFTLSAAAPILRDLKITKQRSHYDNF